MEKFINDIGTVELHLVKKRGQEKTLIEINFLNHAPNFSIINQRIDDEYYFELKLKTLEQNYILRKENDILREIELKEYTIEIPIECYKGKLHPTDKKIYFCTREKSFIELFYLNDKNNLFLSKIGVISQKDTFYFVYQIEKYKFYKHGTFIKCYEIEKNKPLERIVIGHIMNDANIQPISEYEHLIDKELENILMERKNLAIVKKYDFIEQCGTAYVHGKQVKNFTAKDCHQSISPVFFKKYDTISFSKEDTENLKNITLIKRIT